MRKGTDGAQPQPSKWKPGEYCDRCNNTGEVECRCGGDLCVCGRQELVCPRCEGRSTEPFDPFDPFYDQPARSDSA